MTFAAFAALFSTSGCGGSSSGDPEPPEGAFQILVSAKADTGLDLKSRHSETGAETALGTWPLDETVNIHLASSRVVATTAGGKPIKLADLDGSNPADVGEAGEFGTDPVISPDGTKIAYQTSVTVDSFTSLYLAVANADGSGAQLITPRPDEPAQPSFTPDSSKIIFRSNVPSLDIKIVNLDGTGQQTLFDPILETNFPTLSPDGKHLAYVNNLDLWVVKVSNGDEKKVASDVHPAGRIFFSPGGQWIVYTAIAEDLGPISRPSKIRVDGTQHTYLTASTRQVVSGIAPLP